MKRLIPLAPVILLLAVHVLTLKIFPAEQASQPAAFELPRTFPDRLLKYHFDIRTADGEEAPTYHVGYRVDELQKARVLRKGSSVQRDWVSRGPGNIGGRTRGLIIDPDDPTRNTWFAGSVSGGIWKTTNAGQTWQNLTPDLPNLATSTLAMAMSNTNVIYAGTGEGFGNIDAVAGDGMWKSTDKGQTWSRLESTVGSPDFRSVNRIIVDPSNENVLVVAANRSIFRSTDGGASFTEVYKEQQGGSFNAGEIQHVIATPGNFAVQYAGVNSRGILKSTDFGVSWDRVCQDINVGGRIELAVSSLDTDWLYAGVENETSTLFVSTDAGGSCTRVADQIEEPNWLGTQGWYDNTLAGDPFDVRKVYVGGINIWQIDLQETTVEREGLTGMNTDEVEPFLTFVNFTGGTLPGLGLGPDEGAQNLTDDDFVSVEIRWGPGRSQKAHRFLVPQGSTSGVPPEDYTYQDYVDVPFEVWDVTNNRQLMVSFRDQQRDGQFNLRNETEEGREYVFINAFPYNAAAPDPGIAQDAGQTQKLIYFLWFILDPGIAWDPATIPTSKFTIRWEVETVLLSNSSRVSDGAFLHVDHHGLFMTNVNEGSETFRMVSTNDGGIGLSEDSGNRWEMRNGDYVTTQFYGADRHPEQNIYIGGTQDNSTLVSPPGAQSGSQWSTEIGGDGFEAVWHTSDPTLVLGSSQFNNIFKSVDGGGVFLNATGGITDTDVFITRLAKSRIDHDLVFGIGESGVWRTDDFAETWTLSPIPSEDWKNADEEGDVTMSEANPQIVWAGAGVTDTRRRRLHLSTDGGVTFNPVDVLDNSIGMITGIETHPNDENTAYLLFSVQGAPKVVRTTDLGQTWEDISGFAGGNGESTNGFPDVATYSLLVMPHNPDEIWAGTEIGLFISGDNGASWSFADDGLPAAAIWQMQVVEDEVVAATHGRGVWSVQIPELLTAPPPNLAVSPRLRGALWNVTGAVTMDLQLRNAFDSTQVRANGDRIGSVGSTEPGDRRISVRYSPSQEEDIEVQAVAFQNGKPFHSPKSSIRAFPRPPRVGEYVNEFNSLADGRDFSGNGFGVSIFDRWLATLSPYPSNSNLTFTLRTPIQVSDVNSMMTWTDIALVEPGLPGFDWTEPRFRDYVIVEATNDGINWINLVDGYDANFDPDWRALYPSGEQPTAALLREHTVDLRDFFEVGRIIFVRFRLFSDNATQGAGWFIDRVEIQPGAPVANEAEVDLPTEFALHGNYPNPFNPSTNISFSLPERSDVSVRVFDVNGRLVETIASGDLAAGRHTVRWDARDVATGTYFYRLEAGSFVQTRKMLVVK